MRNILFIVLVSLSLLACHNNNQKEAIKEFIPGIYVKEVKNEYFIGNDTLIIQQTSGDNYLIVNRTGYQRIKNNTMQPHKYSEVNLKAVFNNESANLYEQRLGKTFSFDPDKNRLFEGASEYKKILP